MRHTLKATYIFFRHISRCLTERNSPNRRCQSSEYKRRHPFQRGAREACMCMTRLWNAGLRQNHNTDNSQQPPLSLKHTHTYTRSYTNAYSSFRIYTNRSQLALKDFRPFFYQIYPRSFEQRIS